MNWSYLGFYDLFACFALKNNFSNPPALKKQPFLSLLIRTTSSFHLSLSHSGISRKEMELKMYASTGALHEMKF